jgi:hypothetical protein
LRSNIQAEPRLAEPGSTKNRFRQVSLAKIFDHNPLFTMACDKTASKAYAKSVCPELSFARILWTGDDPTLIPDELLVGNVVVKANHGSRWNVMIENGRVDRANMLKQASGWMKRRYGRSFGQWGYKNASHSLFIEEMLLQDGRPIHSEYKFHISGGRAAYVFIERETERPSIKRFYLDRDGQLSAESLGGDIVSLNFTRPACFQHMRDIAERLAAPFDYIRCDLYDLDGEIYFSVLTVYPTSGVGARNQDHELKQLRNSLWDMRKTWFLTTPHTGWRRIYAAALRRWLDKNAMSYGARAA